MWTKTGPNRPSEVSVFCRQACENHLRFPDGSSKNLDLFSRVSTRPKYIVFCTKFVEKGVSSGFMDHVLDFLLASGWLFGPLVAFRVSSWCLLAALSLIL